MREWWRSLRDTYLTVDARSLGAFRILFGVVLLSDWARRWAELEFWYTNSGLLPNHTILWRPPARHLFSLFFGVSTPGEARVGFLLCAAVYLAFTFGYRTRAAQVLALVARVSLNTRLALLENGGDMVMDLLCLLTLPLPLGRRFSIDAVRAALRSPSDALAWQRRPVTSIAMLGLILQFATIYYFNAASKHGVAWRDGTAVHYALHQDRLVTWLGVWMREHLSVPVLHVLTRSVLITEWAGFALIITPIATQPARLAAVIVMPLLHLGFALGLNLGGFSPAMASFYPLLLGAKHWDELERRVGTRAAVLTSKMEAFVRRHVSPASAPPPPEASALRRWSVEAAMALLLVAITTEVLNDNAPVPKVLRVPQPAWARAVIDYPRILQGWRMFASEPSRTDVMIYVDATTAAGEHVDPYNAVASDQPYPKGSVVPTHLGQSQFFVMFTERIANMNYAPYRQAFSEWLLAYPERTGKKEDCLLSYEVYWVVDKSPPPGSGAAKPEPVEHSRFMVYSAPYDSPCRALKPPAKAPADKPIAVSRD